MLLIKCVITICLATLSVASPDRRPHGYGYAPPVSYEAPANYNFNYAVKDQYSGNDFGHQESRDGYNTQGSYYVNLPDGRLQKVTYYVSGDSGFVAEVTYIGEAQYPAYKPTPSYRPAPAYKPAPSYRSAPAYRPTPAYKPAPVYGK